MKKIKPKKMCLCCKAYPAVGKHNFYIISEFCADCNDNRCDAFPSDCWNRMMSEGDSNEPANV